MRIRARKREIKSLTPSAGETARSPPKSHSDKLVFAAPLLASNTTTTVFPLVWSYTSPVIPGPFRRSCCRWFTLAGHREEGGAGAMRQDEGERGAIFMPVFYCALARESRMETICHPVGEAEPVLGRRKGRREPRENFL